MRYNRYTPHALEIDANFPVLGSSSLRSAPHIYIYRSQNVCVFVCWFVCLFVCIYLIERHSFERIDLKFGIYVVHKSRKVVNEKYIFLEA